MMTKRQNRTSKPSRKVRNLPAKTIKTEHAKTVKGAYPTGPVDPQKAAYPTGPVKPQ